MTSTEMLARTRTLLDEASAGFFTDAEIYSALTDGQKQVATVLMTIYMKAQKRFPEVLRPLIQTPVTSSGTSISLPSDFWFDISLKFGSASNNKQTAYRKELKEIPENEDNTYLNNEFYYYINSSTLTFGISGTQYYTFTYLIKPTAISASVEPILQENSHSAIVFWATAQMLIKDAKVQESQVMMKNYADELQVLV